MMTLTKTLVIAAGALAVSATASSAAIVCKPVYKPEFGLRVYGDNWRWKRGEKYRWRKVGRGHGYYRDGVWVTIRP
jgi:hypothetical protein